MIDVNKLDKTIDVEFQQLYAKANPLPNARPKLPLLKVSTVSSEAEADEGDGDESTILCESLILTEYVAEQFAAQGDDTTAGSSNSLLPQDPSDRAVLRLFQELCGSALANYLGLLRSPNVPHLQKQLTTFQNDLLDMNAFLLARRTQQQNGPFLFGNQFTLAECNVAPFAQRCCSILPAKTEQLEYQQLHRIEYSTPCVHPLDICDDLELDCLRDWIHAVLSRPSVVATAPPSDEMTNKQTKFLKRLARIHSLSSHETG